MRPVFALLVSLAAATGPSLAQPVDVPPELRGWEHWVLDGREYLRCPLVDGGTVSSPDGRICVWPGPVAIEAGRTGATFEQTLEVFAPADLPLPGDATAWPQDVTVDGQEAPVVAREGRPHLRISAGAHRVAGRIPWSSMPEALPVPDTYSLVALTLDGVRIAWPERAGGGVRLGAPRQPTQVDRLDVQIYRKLTDTLPGLLHTRVLLSVAGRPRETILGPILPAGLVPMQLAGPLPARFQPDGRLRVQVRPGTWTLELAARTASAIDTLRVPESGVAEEVWSFESVDRLRSATVEGLESIDPGQANVPQDWQQLPAYRLAPGAEFTVRERQRGLDVAADLNQIVVERNLWRDFEGRGYTFQDFVNGSMREDWRLDMKPPYRLQGARQGEQALLITQGGDEAAGVELRSPQLGFEATGRLEPRGRAFEAAGWSNRLARLALNLRLPPGHRLLAAPGADSSPSAWLDRWRLLDIFAVLLVAAVAFRVAGIPAAVLALAAFGLTHLELPALTWAALNLLIAVGLARAVPEGRVRRSVVLWRAVSVAIVVVMLVPFALSQARLALFPQLEASPMPVPLPVETKIVESAELDQVAQDAQLSARGAAPPAVREESAYRLMSKSASVLERYAPGTQLQNGPGVPNWNFQTHRLEWSGPVEPSQTMRLVVLTPVWVGLWRFAGIVLAALAFYAIVRTGYPNFGQPRLDRWLRLAPAAAALALAAALPLSAPVARADTPSPQLLEDLQARLSRPPPCAPECASIARAQVAIGADALEIRLEAHAQSLAALALPEAPQRWQPDRVLLDGAAASLARAADGTLFLALPAGVHAITLRGAVPSAEALRLVFRERPAWVQVSAPGWQVAGLDDGRLIADSLTLTRPVRAVSGDRAPATGDDTRRDEFPPFARVTRTLHLGLDWTITTEVDRLAPEQGAFSLRLPLLPGESVLTAGLPVADGSVEIAVPAGGRAGWSSALKRADSLTLAAPSAGASYVEVWRFEIGHGWHLWFEGTPEVLASEPPGEAWVQRFEPRPSENLVVTIARPAPVEGPTFAFEAVRHTMAPGRRSTDTQLQIDYRSTQGGRHVIGLPAGARLREVSADGHALVLRDQDGQLELPLLPGAHSLQIDWQTDSGVTVATRLGAVALNAPASNVATTIVLPPSRWLLAAAGGGIGPAILYWAELAVFVALALLLGRLRRTPLATHEWLLVGLGLSTFSWGVLLLFAVWVFAFEWRARWTGTVRPWVFDATQIVLVLLTLSALGSLLAAIPNGLLGSPDMHVTGGGSYAGRLEWFHDRIEGGLPRPVAVSVSIWFYKAAMLGWALWLSFALVRWVRWAWEAFGVNGLWRPTGRRLNPFRREAVLPPSSSGA